MWPGVWKASVVARPSAEQSGAPGTACRESADPHCLAHRSGGGTPSETRPGYRNMTVTVLLAMGGGREGEHEERNSALEGGEITSGHQVISNGSLQLQGRLQSTVE